MLKKKKFLISGIVIVLAVGYLIFSSFGSGMYYLEVSELLERGSTVYDQDVRVNGDLVKESVERGDGGLSLKFTITDGKATLPIVYRGVVPDTFDAATEVVAEGRLDESGVFRATNILPKCASKYTPA